MSPDGMSYGAHFPFLTHLNTNTINDTTKQYHLSLLGICWIEKQLTRTNHMHIVNYSGEVLSS